MPNGSPLPFPHCPTNVPGLGGTHNIICKMPLHCPSKLQQTSQANGPHANPHSKLLSTAQNCFPLPLQDVRQTPQPQGPNIILHSNLLHSKIKSSNILDLFSGVGSFGLEAISRGAKKVVFFEDYKPALDLLKKNIRNLAFLDKSEIYQKDISNKNNFFSEQILTQISNLEFLTSLLNFGFKSAVLRIHTTRFSYQLNCAIVLFSSNCQNYFLEAFIKLADLKIILNAN